MMPLRRKFSPAVLNMSVTTVNTGRYDYSDFNVLVGSNFLQNYFGYKMNKLNTFLLVKRSFLWNH